MDQLLKITTVPIEFELKIRNAELQYSTTSTADIEISKNQNGGLQMKSHPIRINMDSFTPGSSVTAPSASGANTALTGSTYAISAQYQPGARNNESGGTIEQYLIHSNASFASAYSAMSGSTTASAYTGNTGASASAAQSMADLSNSDLSVRYQLDKLNFDMKIGNGNFEFIPGDIELVVTQRPEVKIEYIGKPIYVPPSAAEKFLNLEVKA